MKKLCSEIAKREGKKSQVKVGDIREILKIIVEIFSSELVNEEKEPKMYLEFLNQITTKTNKKLDGIAKAANKNKSKRKL